MSQRGHENPRVGLRDVFDTLVKAPPERLLSLTFQLRESPEDSIIQALCLIVLQREAQGLDKLHTMKDNHIAKHLAEKWQMSGGKLEDFAVGCGHFPESTWENLVALARIFKVLSEQRLCDPLLTHLAYERALCCDALKRSSDEDVEYNQLREEAKVVCGPEFAEWVDLKSGSYRDLQSSLDKGSPTLKVTLSQPPSEGADCRPSPLQANSSTLSYPTHLEISVPPTALFPDSKRTPEASDKSNLSSPPHSQTREEHRCKSDHPPSFDEKKHSGTDETFAAKSIKIHGLISPNQNFKPTTEPNFPLPAATNITHKMPVENEMHESNSADEEEEEIFYAFVILHAPEDVDVAVIMRERLETLIGNPGATFSDDFAVPGKSTLRCLEDAINNTAFTLLLLTRNFNTRMLDMETDSALINSLNKKHKYNTVIPLLPRENCMPQKSLPLVLQTLVPLEENRSFERKAKMSLSLAKIKLQKKIWAEEQRVSIQIRRQQRLKQLKQRKKQLIKESEMLQTLEKERLGLLMMQTLRLSPSGPPAQDGGDGWAWSQQPSHIHIENARYIMIGNDSQMTVDLGGVENKDEEEQ